MYDITIYFDVKESSPLYGVGFTTQIEARSSMAPEVMLIEAALEEMLEAGELVSLAEIEVGS